jgi:peptidoglycan/LPS O-acetylase OafA/YrhL
MSQITLAGSNVAPGVEWHPQKARLRGDIQGLRALAVLMVIADHMLGYPVGGFVGVDVFFVISGFVITGSLLREHQSQGNISFRGFYQRRIRRIIPLALLVLAATIIASWVTFTVARAMSVTVDGIWSVVFAANWKYAIDGTDYMQAGGPVSPLQHFWSLAVEEQFYIVWPWLVVLTLGYAASRLRWTARRAHQVLGLLMVVVVVASFGYALWDTATSPAVAYFSTFSRAWELGIGALIAVGAVQLGRIPESVRPFMAYIGLAGIFWSVFSITPEMAFPGPWAAVPVLSTALVIAAGCGGEQRLLSPLTNPVMRYVGDISYSLYLWHFPVIIVLAALMPERGQLYFLISGLAITVLAVASYKFIEDPIRAGRWDSRTLRRRAMVAAAGLLAASLVIVATQPPSPGGGEVQSPSAGFSESLQSEIYQATTLDRFPTATPSLEDKDAWVPEQMLTATQCLNPKDLSDRSLCTYGTGAKLALVVGDSVAVSWIPAIVAALEPEGYKVHGVGLSDCPFAHAAIALKDNPQRAAACNASKDAIETQIRELKPELVITTDYEGSVIRLASGSTGEAAISEYTDGLVSAIDMAKGYGSQVIVLAPNPSGVAPAKCITKVATPDDCTGKISGAWAQKDRAERDAANRTNTRYVDSRQWFCTPEGKCPLVVGNLLTRWDHVHLTKQYAAVLGGIIAPSLIPDARPLSR